MTSLVDYNYYKDIYGGVLVTHTSFERISLQASYMINNLTMGRAEKSTEYVEEIKLATCGIIDKMQEVENAGGVVISETVGKISKTFSTASKDVAENKLYYRVALIYLANTGLLYRGVR